MSLQRRDILALAALAAAPAVARSQPRDTLANAHVVLIGGGFGGATAARYLRAASPGMRITLIEPNESFVMCPLSNRVLHGGMKLRELTHPYDRFATRHDVEWIQASADAIDPDARLVIAGSRRIRYDRLIVAPGVELLQSSIPGLERLSAQRRIPHAWKAGEQTLELRRRLVDMPDKGTFAMHIPKVPYRCPPGPYERASLVAHYLKLTKPAAKLLVFDANPDIQAKKGLFEKLWTERHAGRVQYVPNADIREVDAAAQRVDFDVHGKVQADVWNIIPPQRAGAIATRSGLADVANLWCGVDFLTYESKVAPRVHLIGDSIAGSPGMPKSGHMANQQAKVCAAAVAALLADQPPVAQPIFANTCYSFVSDNEAAHVASVFRYSAEKRVMAAVKEATGVSERPSVAEAIYAMAWASTIMSDTMG